MAPRRADAAPGLVRGLAGNIRRWAPGYLFILPAVIFLFALTVYPSFYLLGLSLTDWKLTNESQFIGLESAESDDVDIGLSEEVEGSGGKGAKIIDTEFPAPGVENGSVEKQTAVGHFQDTSLCGGEIGILRRQLFCRS